MRRFLETVLRGSTCRRRLPADFGRAPLVVSLSCGLRYLRRNMEKVDPTLLRLSRAYVQPGASVWDIGGNAGLFTFASAARAGRGGEVVTFEPDTELVRTLRLTASLQPPSSAAVTIMPVAVAEDVRPRTFLLAKRSRSTNHLDGYGSQVTGGVRESQTVLTVSLDWALAHFRRPDVVKIDVEGAETEVLRGARRLLAEARPIVICEVSSEAARVVTGILKDAGYRIADADGGDDQADLDAAPFNTLAIPRPA